MIINIYIPQDYLPVMIQSFIALGFIITTMVVTHLAGPKRSTNEKLENFECGIEGMGNARSPFSIKYFLNAILFVLFDVEVIFMYPFAVNYLDLGWEGFIGMLIFINICIFGLWYAIQKGVLNWSSTHNE